MPPLSQLKQTKKGNTHTKVYPHTTYPSKISHKTHYPLRKRSYYSQDPNPSLSFSTTQHLIPISLPKNTITSFFLILPSNNLIPNGLLSFANRQLHLQRRALLRVERHLTPKPPFLLCKQTIAHLTRKIQGKK